MFDNISAINDALESCNFNELKLERQEMNKLPKLPDVLEPLNSITNVLGGEKYSTAAIVLPLLYTFGKVLAISEDDPQYLTELKIFMKNDLEKRCNENLDRVLLGKASYFHPKYKCLSFLDENEKRVVKDALYSELKSLTINHDTHLTVPTAKKKRYDLSFESDNDSIEYEVEDEIKHYEIQPRIRDQNLMEYWRNNSNSYPHLAQLARKYLCVTATSTPAERVFSKLGLILTKTQMSLDPDNVEKIIFLSVKFAHK